jgi:hypothetical protein
VAPVLPVAPVGPVALTPVAPVGPCNPVGPVPEVTSPAPFKYKYWFVVSVVIGYIVPNSSDKNALSLVPHAVPVAIFIYRKNIMIMFQLRIRLISVSMHTIPVLEIP